MNKDALWASGQDETVEVNQRALIDSACCLPTVDHAWGYAQLYRR